MPRLDIKRTQRRVGVPEERIFDPGPANTSVEKALVGLGRDITSATKTISAGIEAKKDRDDQININKARIDYANELSLAEKDVFADENIKSEEALNNYILKSQELTTTLSDKYNLNDRARTVFQGSTVSRVTHGIDNLSRAFQQRDNNAVVQTIAASEAEALQDVVLNPTSDNAQRLIDNMSFVIDGYAANPLINAGVFGRAGASAVEVKENITNKIFENMVSGQIQQDADGTLTNIESGELDYAFKDAKTKQLYEDEARRQIAVNKRDQKIIEAEAQKVEGERIYDTFAQGQLTYTEIDNANLPTNEKLAWRSRLKGAATNAGEKYTKSDPDVYSQVYIALTTNGLVAPLTDDDIIAFMGKGLSVQDVAHFRAVLAESNKPESIATKKADTIALGTLKAAFEAGEFGTGREGLFEYTRQVGDFEKWRATHPNGDSAAYMADTFKKPDNTLMDKVFGGKSDAILVRTERRARITFDALLAAAREQDPNVDAQELREAFIEEFQ